MADRQNLRPSFLPQPELPGADQHAYEWSRCRKTLGERSTPAINEAPDCLTAHAEGVAPRCHDAAIGSPATLRRRLGRRHELRQHPARGFRRPRDRSDGRADLDLQPSLRGAPDVLDGPALHRETTTRRRAMTLGAAAGRDRALIIFGIALVGSALWVSCAQGHAPRRPDGKQDVNRRDHNDSVSPLGEW